MLLSTFVCLLIATPSAAVAERERVYLGGFPIGISIDVGGLLVESVSGVETEYGTAEVEGLCRGDIIKTINGTAVGTVDEMQSLLTDAPTEIVLIRGGETIKTEVRPIIEIYSDKPRLGVKVKEKLYGIGTVSFVALDRSYAALGHEIYDSETGTHIPFTSGKIHRCKVLGVKRGEKGEAGAILASLDPDAVYGTVVCNNSFGIAGEFTADVDLGTPIEVAHRSEVKPGRAQIRTAVDGTPQFYDIEIIKAVRQTGRREKGIIFRVTDKRLLDMTGGVVRGMSGSPIIQDGKLAGSVTHVILNDFTKGYGVYADCLN